LQKRTVAQTWSPRSQVAFIIMIVGAVIGYGQSMNELKKPLTETMKFFDAKGVDNDKTNTTITNAWNQVQEDVGQIFFFKKATT
jgi:hypothetical protein